MNSVVHCAHVLCTHAPVMVSCVCVHACVCVCVCVHAHVCMDAHVCVMMMMIPFGCVICKLYTYLCISVG